jgi:uncharacterized protein
MQRQCIPLILWLLAAVPAAAGQQSAAALPPDHPTVTTVGEGSLRRAPDRAWLSVTAESRSKSPREAQKLNATVMTVVLQKLKEAGLPPDAIQTRAYELHPEYDYENGRQSLRGYLARNTIEIRADDLTRVGELLDIAVSAGATSVGNVRFDLKDRAAVEREAIRLAVDDARRRAEAAAAGAGMKVDRIHRIEEHRPIVSPPRPMVAFEAMRQAEASARPPIEAGELEVRATVTLTAIVR